MKRINLIKDFEVDVKLLIKEYRLHADNLMKDQLGNTNGVIVQRKFHPILDDVKHKVMSNMPYTESIADKVHDLFPFTDMTYRMVMPSTAYAWHTDQGNICYHIPLITNLGCHFVYEDQTYQMPLGNLYAVQNGVAHTFVNAGPETRLHIVFERLPEIQRHN